MTTLAAHVVPAAPQASPSKPPPLPVDYAVLHRALFGEGARIPVAEEWRTEFGRATTLATIASALREADDGYMRDITDLEQETLSIDPHLASVVTKRIGSVAGVDWDLTPAQGDGLDKERARYYADRVRSQLAGIRRFKQSIKDIAWGLFHGRASSEIHWDLNCGGDMPRRVRELGWIHPRRLSFGPYRELRVVDTASYQGNFKETGVDLRQFPHKFIQFKPRLFNEYAQREGLAPKCLYWSYFKRFSARERMVLLELFGKPWKIVEADPTGNAGAAELDLALEQADALASATAAQFPKGIKFRVESPDPKSGELHNETIADCDRQISKLVLGATGTTDALANRAESQTHKEEQNIHLVSDGDLISQVIQSDLICAIMVLNWGPQSLPYAPLFQLRTAPAKDRKSELDRVTIVLSMGIPIAADEIRELAGFRKPGENEAFVQLIDSPQDDASARFVPPRMRVIDPTGTEPGQDLFNAPDAGFVYVPVAGDDGVTPVAPGQMGADAVPDTAPADPDDWDIFHGPINRMIEQHAEVGAVYAAEGVTNFPTSGDNLKVSLRNSRFLVYPALEAEAIKTEWPDIWMKGGNVLGNLQFRRLAPIAKRGGVVETDTEEEAVRLREAWAARHHEDHNIEGVIAQVKWLVIGQQGLERMRRVIAEERARIRERKATASGVAVLLAGRSADDKRQPETVNGSPESIIYLGTDAGTGITDRWATAMASSVEGKSTAASIRTALRKAAAGLDVQQLADDLEPAMVHGAMLGAFDAHWEMDNDAVIAPALFAVGPTGEQQQVVLRDAIHAAGGGQKNFATKPFNEAIAFFKSKAILTKQAFERLSNAAKKRAFTIAGLARRSMLETAFSELANAIAAGLDLRKFRMALNDRFESAGWTRINNSHTEVVFRNAVMGAYSSGRHAQMTQPAVLKARPYWQITGPNDTRNRDSHAAAHGKVLRADDPFWKRTPLTWGHNCRCRKVSRSEKDIKRLGLKVVDGSTLKNLPDPGWDSSESLLY
jgi:phage gp29-like protein